ncbi:hypothetical protein VNO77_23037 [Canavalia gladiata]|uniref:Uncharacterized protein n=1 Tax=Canavalia gladiata TaxID=3824 RepID=A0AAN9L3W6_CANGL
MGLSRASSEFLLPFVITNSGGAGTSVLAANDEIGKGLGRRAFGDRDRKLALGTSYTRGLRSSARIQFLIEGARTSRFCLGVLARRSKKQTNECYAKIHLRWLGATPANDRTTMSVSVQIGESADRLNLAQRARLSVVSFASFIEHQIANLRRIGTTIYIEQAWQFTENMHGDLQRKGMAI